MSIHKTVSKKLYLHFSFYFIRFQIKIYYRYYVNDNLQLIVLDQKFFQCQTEECDSRISKYLYDNYFILKWILFKSDLIEEKTNEIIYSYLIMVSILLKENFVYIILISILFCKEIGFPLRNPLFNNILHIKNVEYMEKIL